MKTNYKVGDVIEVEYQSPLRDKMYHHRGEIVKVVDKIIDVQFNYRQEPIMIDTERRGFLKYYTLELEIPIKFKFRKVKRG